VTPGPAAADPGVPGPGVPGPGVPGTGDPGVPGTGDPGVPGTGDPAHVARTYVESFAAGDADAIASHVSAGFANDHASALGASSVSRDEYRQRLDGFLASFPGLTYRVDSVIAAGGQVAVEYRMTATSDGHPIDIPGVMVLTVADGLITRRTDYWDALTFLRQTHALPPPT